MLVYTRVVHEHPSWEVPINSNPLWIIFEHLISQIPMVDIFVQAPLLQIS